MFLWPGYQRQMVSNDNRGRVTREKQVTSFSQVEAQARPSRLNSHTVLNTFTKNVSFFQWWKVAVLSSGITTALIERQELRCVRVRADRTRDCCLTRFAIFSVHFEGHSGT